jgi:hypothetical protein
MTYESRLLAGILLIILPSVMIGGVSILSLLIGDPAYMQNPLRQDLWRAGHAHAGVRLILALVALRQSVQCHEMGRPRFDSDRRDPGPGSLLPVCAVARFPGPEQARLSRLCRRSAAGRRRARSRRRPRQAPGTTLLIYREAMTRNHNAKPNSDLLPHNAMVPNATNRHVRADARLWGANRGGGIYVTCVE